MNPQDAKTYFEDFAAEKGVTIAAVSISSGIDVMLDFYRNIRADGCDETDTDMLLYQWGREPNGQFAIDLTRQLIFGGDDDENIWQLSLTFNYSAEPCFEDIGSGNKWCYKPHPGAIDYFSKFIRDSEPFAAATGQGPVSIKLDYFCAG